MPQKVHADNILALWREAFPDKTIVEDFTNTPRRNISADKLQSDRLIEGWQGGWTDWKVIVVDNSQPRMVIDVSELHSEIEDWMRIWIICLS
jgi:hypothetical protein